MLINENILRLLKETGRTQIELAEYIGAKKQTVNYWLKNNGEIPARYVPAISKFFGIPLEGLFWEYVSTHVKHDVLIHDGVKKFCPRCGYSDISEDDKSCGNCGLLFVNHCSDPDCRMNTGWDDPVCLSYTTCFCPECGAPTTFFANGDINEKTSAFDYATKGLSEDEADLVEIFRKLDKSGKRIILGHAEELQRTNGESSGADKKIG